MVVLSVAAAGLMAGCLRGESQAPPAPSDTARLSRALVEDGRLFRYDFDVPGNPLTVVSGGTWTVADQVLRLDAPASGFPNGNLAVAAPVIDGDFTLYVNARAVAGAGWNDFSVVFAYKSPDDYHFVSFNEGEDEETNGVFRWRGGVLTKLASLSWLTTPGQWSFVRVTRNGNTVIVAKDGDDRHARVAFDATMGGGQVGLGSRNDSALFDELEVLVPQPRADAFPVRVNDPPPGAFVSGFVYFEVLSDQALTVRFDPGPLVSKSEPSSAPFAAQLDTIALQNGLGPIGADAWAPDGRFSQAPNVTVIVRNDCTHADVGQGFSSVLRTYGTRLITIQWYAKPGATAMDGGFAVSDVAARYFSQSAASVIFAPSGRIEARDGDHYAAVDSVPFTAQIGYLFRMDLDLTQQRYSVIGRTANGPQFTIARDFALRSGRTYDSLGYWSVIVDPASAGYVDVCNVEP
jgi:hypothetical protein